MSLLPHVSDDLLDFGGSDWYPLGDWSFKILEIYENDLGMQPDGSPFRGFQTTDGEQISLRIGEFQPLGGQESPPGNNMQFIKICLRDGAKDITTVDPADREYRELAKGLRKAVAIARVLGEEPSMEFVEALRKGDFNDRRRIGATFVEWRANNSKGSYPKKFFPVG